MIGWSQAPDDRDCAVGYWHPDKGQWFDGASPPMNPFHNPTHFAEKPDGPSLVGRSTHMTTKLKLRKWAEEADESAEVGAPGSIDLGVVDRCAKFLDWAHGLNLDIHFNAFMVPEDGTVRLCFYLSGGVYVELTAVRDDLWEMCVEGVSGERMEGLAGTSILGLIGRVSDMGAKPAETANGRSVGLDWYVSRGFEWGAIQAALPGLQDKRGKFIVACGNTIVGVYDTYREAFVEGRRHVTPSDHPFVVQEIGDPWPEPTWTTEPAPEEKKKEEEENT